MFNFRQHSNNSPRRGFRFFVTTTALAGLITGGILTMNAGAQDAPAASQDSQSQPPAPPMEGGHGRHKMPSVDEQVKHLTKRLSLNDDQQAKVRSALTDQRAQMEQIHNDSSLSREDRGSKMKAIHESTNSQIRSVLNEDQQKKFDEMQQKREARMKDHQGPPPQQQQTPQPQQ
jgi:periplasmic protein CpxP/Spy